MGGEYRVLRTGFEPGTINDKRLAQMTSSNKKQHNLLLFTKYR